MDFRRGWQEEGCKEETLTFVWGGTVWAILAGHRVLAGVEPDGIQSVRLLEVAAVDTGLVILRRGGLFIAVSCK